MAGGRWTHLRLEILMAERFTGVLTALATPFSDDGSALDLKALAGVVERQLAAGAAGLVPCGTTGEFSALTEGERRTLVEHCVELTDGRAAVIPQTGALSTAATVAHSRHAADIGCAAALVMPPFFGTMSQTELQRHLDAVTQAVEIPVIYYHNPQVTGLALPPARLAAICRSVSIRYVKYTSPDVTGFVELSRQADIAQVLPAWDHLLPLAFLSGVRGTIWGAAAAAPELCLGLYRTAMNDAARTFLAAWDRAAPLFSALGELGYTQAVKALSAMDGTPVGPPRAPLLAVDADGRERLYAALRAAATEALA
jgi:4-hydroxy-tetrahydrodipicolinate synthase